MPEGYKPLTQAAVHKLLRVTKKKELAVERDSVYGAAILMPQVARSSSWNSHFTSLMVSAYAYLAFCIFLHGALLTFIAKEERVMDAFGGQMYLCDFGAAHHCDDVTLGARVHSLFPFLGGPSDQSSANEACMGPGGTHITPPRLYSWEQYTTRSFVRDTLKGIYPDKKDSINKFADPGEYGIESYFCRLLCVFIFIASIMSEIWLCVDMATLFWMVPNSGDSWILKDSSAEDARLKVVGMTRPWKVANTVFVLIPKCCLVWLTASWGVSFLMETAGIDDIIVNSVALGFLLSMDEVITSNLMSEGSKILLQTCEAYSSAAEEPKDLSCLEMLYDLIFHRLFGGICVVLITAAFVAQYYAVHCEWYGGQFVSKAMYLPKTLDFNFLNAFWIELFGLVYEREPYWTMPRS